MLFTECIIRFACGIHQPIEILEKLVRSSCLLHASYVSSAVSTSHFFGHEKIDVRFYLSKLRALQCLNFSFCPCIRARQFKTYLWNCLKHAYGPNHPISDSHTYFPYSSIPLYPARRGGAFSVQLPRGIVSTISSIVAWQKKDYSGRGSFVFSTNRPTPYESSGRHWDFSRPYRSNFYPLRPD